MIRILNASEFFEFRKKKVSIPETRQSKSTRRNLTE